MHNGPLQMMTSAPATTATTATLHRPFPRRRRNLKSHPLVTTSRYLLVLRLALHFILFTTSILVLTRPIEFFHIPPLTPLTLFLCIIAPLRHMLPPFSILPLYVVLAAGRGYIYVYTHARGMCGFDSPWSGDRQVRSECAISGAAWWGVVGCMIVEVAEGVVVLLERRRKRRDKEAAERERVGLLGRRRDSEEDEGDGEERGQEADSESGTKKTPGDLAGVGLRRESREWGQFVGRDIESGRAKRDGGGRDSGEWSGFLGMEA